MISAASILAKVHRDALLEQLDREDPRYGFAEHKGYATPAHIAALRLHGPCVHHRAAFARVKDAQLELLFGNDPDAVEEGDNFQLEWEGAAW